MINPTIMKTFISFFALLIFASFTTNLQQNDLVFRDNDQVIQLELATKNNYLVFNEPTEIKVSVEKIDLKKSSIIGKGISLTGEQGKNYLVISITANEENVFNNQYSITFNYPTGRNKKLKNHKFLIPVKKVIVKSLE